MSFIDVHPLLFHSAVIFASLIILAKSADLVVYGITNYARKLGISDYLIGFLIVSIGTSLPDLIAAMTAASLRQGGLVFGGLFGANLFAIPILGFVLLVAKKIKTKQHAIGNAPLTTLFICIMPIFLVTDGFLSRFEGFLLLLAFFIYVLRLWQGEKKRGVMKKSIQFKEIYKDILIFCLALAALLLSARWLVFSSIRVAHTLEVSPFLIGLFVIGVGGSFPELTVQTRSILRGRNNIAFGNVLGSIVANSAFVLGIVAIINPFFVKFSLVYMIFIFMAIGILYILRLMSKEFVTWKHGLVLFLIYILFLVAQVVF